MTLIPAVRGSDGYVIGIATDLTACTAALNGVVACREMHSCPMVK
ncbi:hypothetical protein ACFXG6_00625 [Streptomyces roseus]